MFITRPSGIDLSADRVTLDVRDENGLRAATIVIVTGTDGTERDVVKVNVHTVPGDGNLIVETRVVQGS